MELLGAIISAVAIVAILYFTAKFILYFFAALIKGVISLLVLKNIILLTVCIISFFIILGLSGFSFAGVLLGGITVGILTALFTRFTFNH